MAGYRNILCAVDFTAHSEKVGRRALEFAAPGARLTFMHVVEFLPIALDNEVLLPPSTDLETQLLEQARKRLDDYIALLGSPVCERNVALGATKLELLSIAESLQVDLIVVGSHGRHGLARILGSTANAVLHGAPCDVLAVRLAE